MVGKCLLKSCPCANQGLWTIPPAVALLAQDTPMRVGAGCRGPARMPELVADPRLFRSVECAGGAPSGTHDGAACHLGYASRNRLPTASAARRTSSLDVKRMHQFAALFYGCAEPRRSPERPARSTSACPASASALTRGNSPGRIRHFLSSSAGSSAVTSILLETMKRPHLAGRKCGRH